MDTSAAPTDAWLSPTASARRQEVLEPVRAASTDQLRALVDSLIAENTEIHERQSLNLNPASNVMSPRAEAALSAHLGSRASLGHAGEKYEMGLEAVEQIELHCAQLARRVFGARHAEARVASGAMANLYAFMACCSPGDAIIVPPASVGGHVTHNVDGAAGLYRLEIHEAPIDPTTYSVDPAGVHALAKKVRPRLISVGASLNLLPHPVAQLREIADDVGATLLFDAAHACGLFAGQAWPNPLDEGAHVMTMSTYKSLGGPAGGLVVTNEPAIAERIDAIAYPGLTANFDVGRVTALAFTLLDWIDHGAAYIGEMRASAAALAASLTELGLPVFSTERGPTESHQFAVDSSDGHADAVRLRQAGLLTSAIGLPFGEGVRFGTPEAVRWGMTATDMPVLAELIHRALVNEPSTVAADVRSFRAPFNTVKYCS